MKKISIFIVILCMTLSLPACSDEYYRYTRGKLSHHELFSLFDSTADYSNTINLHIGGKYVNKEIRKMHSKGKVVDSTEYFFIKEYRKSGKALNIKANNFLVLNTYPKNQDLNEGKYGVSYYTIKEDSIIEESVNKVPGQNYFYRKLEYGAGHPHLK